MDAFSDSFIKLVVKVYASSVISFGDVAPKPQLYHGVL